MVVLLKDLACANRLQNNLEDVMKAVEKILIEQNNPNSSLHFHVSKGF